jgi:anti-sigma regulatory factor (Ser/Thr protein kinase)
MPAPGFGPRILERTRPDGPPTAVDAEEIPVRTDVARPALVRRRFARRPEEVAAARRFIRGGLNRGSDAWETAQLLVSETVTSALDQAAPSTGSGTLEVGYAIAGGRLRVEVSDDGGPARLRRRVHAVGSAGGRGLELVRALASRWGVRESSAGRTIWFEIDLTGG